MKACLGFDTSNYKTSAALFDPEHGVVKNCGRLLEVAQGQLGLRQSDALFQHVRHLADVAEELLQGHEASVGAVGFSSRPRSAQGSYMPCFLAGEMAARCIAATLKVPAYSFSHQQGHIASALYSSGKTELFHQPFLSWHLSGGTTELLLVTPGEQEQMIEAEIIGGTQDVAAGQIIDRAGVALNTPFPAGIYIDEMARQSQSKESFIPKTNGLFFSLSGLENKFRRKIEAGDAPEDVAAFTVNSIVAIVGKITALAREKYHLPILFSGGVTASSQMHSYFQGAEGVYFAENGYNGDNALGAALLAHLSAGGSL